MNEETAKVLMLIIKAVRSTNAGLRQITYQNRGFTDTTDRSDDLLKEAKDLLPEGLLERLGK